MTISCSRMVTTALRSRHVQVYVVLFACFALATLQNVTVDDAVLTGAVVPMYLPAANWNQGEECTGCLAKPDPAYAFNGTWHDTTFLPKSAINQTITFTFEGTGLYIFFILANTVSGATTTTNLNFFLDDDQVSTFEHTPSTSTEYEYNQLVYANDSIPYGQHTMQIAAVDDLVTHILFLFDYVIYTTGTEASSVATSTTEMNVTATGTASSVVSLVPSSTLNATRIPRPSLRSNIRAIVGGTVAAVCFVVVIGAYLLYRRQFEGCIDSQFSVVETIALEPFFFSHRTRSILSEGTLVPVPNRHPPTEPVPMNVVSRRKTATLAAPEPVSTSNASSSGPSSTGNAEILEQVGFLRDEVARLRRLQDQTLDIHQVPSESPPEYS